MSSLRVEDFTIKGEELFIVGCIEPVCKITKGWQALLADRPDSVKLVSRYGEPGRVREFLKSFGLSFYVPIYDWAGRMVGGYLRSLEGSRHLTDMGTAPFFFSEYLVEGVALIFIVEGPLDLFSVVKWRAPSMAMMTSGISKFQLDWLKLMRCSGWEFKLIFIRDNDENQAGLKGTTKSVSKCSKIGIEAYTFPTPFGEGDPGDLYGDVRFGSWIKSIQETVL